MTASKKLQAFKKGYDNLGIRTDAENKQRLNDRIANQRKQVGLVDDKVTIPQGRKPNTDSKSGFSLSDIGNYFKKTSMSDLINVGNAYERNPVTGKKYGEKGLPNNNKTLKGGESLLDRVFSNSDKSKVAENVRKQVGFPTSTGRKVEPYAQNRGVKDTNVTNPRFPNLSKGDFKESNYLFNNNSNKSNDGSLSRPDINETINSNVSKGKKSKYIKKGEVAKPSNNTPTKTIENKPTESITTTNSLAGGDRFNRPINRFNIDEGNGVKPLSAEELANQRKNQSKMLSDEELANQGKKKGLGWNIDKDKIANGLNQYGSDIIGLMRKYPNEPAPTLNKEVSLERMNLNSNRAENERDFSKVRRQAETVGSSNYGSVLGSYLGKKLEANNQIAQSESNSNNQIANREAMINSDIRSKNNALNDDYNNRKYNRNVDIQNANQTYLGNINQKALIQNREKNQSDLDLAKLGVEYAKIDEGVSKKANSILGSDIQDASKQALGNLTKKYKSTYRKGGKLGAYMK
jgi:hypothetical protein